MFRACGRWLARDYVRLSIGGRLRHAGADSDRRTALVPCETSAADGEAVAVQRPWSLHHVTADDTGAGLALEAVEAAALVKCDVMVTVGSQITWQPLRRSWEPPVYNWLSCCCPQAAKWWCPLNG